MLTTVIDELPSCICFMYLIVFIVGSVIIKNKSQGTLLNIFNFIHQCLEQKCQTSG